MNNVEDTDKCVKRDHIAFMFYDFEMRQTKYSKKRRT